MQVIMGRGLFGSNLFTLASIKEIQKLHRIRMIILGKNPGTLQAHTKADIYKSIQIPAFTEDQQLTENSPEQGSSPSSSVSQTSPQTPEKMMERDGLLYIAGYLKLKN